MQPRIPLAKDQFRVDIPKLSGKTDRHIYITIQLLAGDSSYDIARLCGNSAAIIEKHYDQVRDEQIAKKRLSPKVHFNADGDRDSHGREAGRSHA